MVRRPVPECMLERAEGPSETDWIKVFDAMREGRHVDLLVALCYGGGLGLGWAAPATIHNVFLGCIGGTPLA